MCCRIDCDVSAIPARSDCGVYWLDYDPLLGGACLFDVLCQLELVWVHCVPVYEHNACVSGDKLGYIRGVEHDGSLMGHGGNDAFALHDYECSEA